MIQYVIQYCDIMDLLQLGAIYTDTDKTIDFLRENGLLVTEYRCCQNLCSEVKSKSSDGREFACKICKKRYSIRTGSFFKNARIKIRYLLLLIFLFAADTELCTCVKLVSHKISQKSISQWFAFLREVCSTALLNTPNVIGGPGHIVEVDESALGRKRKYFRGYERGSGLKWVLGMIDRTTKHCHVQLVPNRTRDTIIPIIQAHVTVGTTIHSDEAAIYGILSQRGYHHKTVKHKENYVNPIDGTHTNTVENFWTHLKHRFKKLHGVNYTQLPLHLDEHMYRWNKKFEGPVFEQLLNEIRNQYPL